MITSLNNPTVKHARALLEPKGRREQGRCLVEGVRLIEEAMRAGIAPALLFFVNEARAQARTSALLAEAERQGAAVIELAGRVFGTLTDTVASQGVIAVVAIPHVPPLPVATFALVLDQVRDPGNVGAIMRSAEAAGVEQVILGPGCVDPWNPKVVRSGMGAHFRLPVITATWWDDVTQALGRLPLWLAESRDAQPYDTLDWTEPSAIGIGGEAAGFSREAHQLSTGRVKIPMAGPVESLNAAIAAGVLMFEVARQRRGKARAARFVR